MYEEYKDKSRALISLPSCLSLSYLACANYTKFFTGVIETIPLQTLMLVWLLYTNMYVEFE